MSVTKVVRYRTKPEQADENARLIEAVFAELADQEPDGLHYADLPSRRRGELPARGDPRRRGEPAGVITGVRHVPGRHRGALCRGAGTRRRVDDRLLRPYVITRDEGTSAPPVPGVPSDRRPARRARDCPNGGYR